MKYHAEIDGLRSLFSRYYFLTLVLNHYRGAFSMFCGNNATNVDYDSSTVQRNLIFWF